MNCGGADDEMDDDVDHDLITVRAAENLKTPTNASVVMLRK